MDNDARVYAVNATFSAMRAFGKNAARSIELRFNNWALAVARIFRASSHSRAVMLLTHSLF
jgi:hypothetical protein